MPNRSPVIDMGLCSDCGTCVELCPAVFRKNRETGVIEVEELAEYPEEAVREAMVYCPRECIGWGEDV